MLSVLCSGKLVKTPERRTSNRGRDYATALLRVPVDGEDAILVSAIVFNADAVEALLAHAKGDEIALAGSAKLTHWTTAGEERHGVSVVADKILSTYMVGRRRKAAAEGSSA